MLAIHRTKRTVLASRSRPEITNFKGKRTKHRVGGDQKKIIRAPLICHLDGKESVYIVVTICLFPLSHVYTNKCAGVATETEVRIVPAAIYNFTTEET